MADLQGRLSPACLEEFEDEALDPRIQFELERLNGASEEINKLELELDFELERLNGASEEINKLELELDDARASFRQTLSDTTHKLDAIARKLGSCVEKARPYYDARMKAKEVQVETQKAAYMYERACSMHEAAKEMVQVAEQGYMQREEIPDSAWQEMLNHATMKVNEAEKDRLESEAEHRKMTMKFKVAQDVVQKLQQELKRNINKSKPYFEMKAKFNQQMEDQKRCVNKLEKGVVTSKNSYSEALRNLEEISEEIHRLRLEQRNQAELGVREAGVGSESPSPPPMRGSEPLSIDGKTMQVMGSCSTSISQTSASSSQSINTYTTSQEMHLPSVIYSSVDKARTPSYRKAIEEQQSSRLSPNSEGSQILDSVDENYSVNIDNEFLSLPSRTSEKDNTDGSDENVFQKHPPKDSDRKRKDSESKRRKSLHEDISHISEGYVGEVTPKSETKEAPPQGAVVTAEKVKKPAKLQGLILQIGPGSNPLETAPHLRKSGKGSGLVRQNTEPQAGQRPASYPVTHNSQVTRQALPVVTPEEKKKLAKSEEKKQTVDLTPERVERRLLKAPSLHDFDDASVSEISDTESITSGTMLDDDQVEFLTMDFSHQRIESPDVSDRHQSERHHWARMSLPTNLSHLENYIRQVSEEHLKNETIESEKTPEPDTNATITDRDVTPDQNLDVVDENIEEEATTRL